MKKCLIAATALSGLLAFAGSASAADLAAPVDPVHDWSGFYVGLQGGYGWGNDNNEVSGAIEEDLEGFVGGAHLGWNSQVDSIVFGLEADVEASFMDADLSAGVNTADLDMNVLGSLRARIGYAIDAVLIYATGGLAVADFDYEISNGVATESFDDTPLGYTVGGGVEVAFTETLSGRLEYRYTDLGSESFTSALFPVDTFDADYDFHAVRAGISWNF